MLNSNVVGIYIDFCIEHDAGTRRFTRSNLSPNQTCHSTFCAVRSTVLRSAVFCCRVMVGCSFFFADKLDDIVSNAISMMLMLMMVLILILIPILLLTSKSMLISMLILVSMLKRDGSPDDAYSSTF